MLKSVFKFLGLLPKTINDDLFGELDVSTHKYEGKEYQHFYFEKYFSPTKSNVWIDISSYSETPSKVQKEIYKHLEKNYAHIIEQINSSLRKDYANDITKFNITNFGEEFTLMSINFDDEENGSILWWLDYKLKTNEKVYFEAHFEKLEIDYLEIDSHK